MPIAVGYTLAHYPSLVIVEGTRGVQLLLAPWGIVIPETSIPTPDASTIVVAQVALIVVGHLLGVLVTHARAARARPNRPLLLLADELPGVLLMVAYTWAGLFLLFAA